MILNSISDILQGIKGLKDILAESKIGTNNGLYQQLINPQISEEAKNEYPNSNTIQKGTAALGLLPLITAFEYGCAEINKEVLENKVNEPVVQQTVEQKPAEIYSSHIISKDLGLKVIERYGDVDENQQPHIDNKYLYVVGCSRVRISESSADYDAYTDATYNLLHLINKSEGAFPVLTPTQSEVIKVEINPDGSFPGYIAEKVYRILLSSFDEKTQKMLKDKYSQKKPNIKSHLKWTED